MLPQLASPVLDSDSSLRFMVALYRNVVTQKEQSVCTNCGRRARASSVLGVRRFCKTLMGADTLRRL